jgi:calcineurin-like phosphoesterase
LRPANYVESLPAKGVIVVEARNGVRCAILNLQGRVYMPQTDCPFRKADALLAELDPEVRVRFLDFPCRADERERWPWAGTWTVEFLQWSAHTRIFRRPTPAFFRTAPPTRTDVGMTGPYHSVIGVDKDIILQRFLTQLPVRMEAAGMGGVARGDRRSG